MSIDVHLTDNLEDALERLAEEGAHRLAGGTDTLLRLKAGRLVASKPVSISDLDDVREEPDRVELGALTLVAGQLGHPIFARAFPCGVAAAAV